MNIPDGVACVHRACLSHKTYPCPFCGRIAGRALTHVEKIAKAAMKALDMPVEEALFKDCVKAVKPIVQAAVAGGIRSYNEPHTLDWRPEDCLVKIDTKMEARLFSDAAIAEEQRPWISIADAVKNTERHTSDGGFMMMPPWERQLNRPRWCRIISAVLWAPFRFFAEVLNGIRSVERDIGIGLK